MLYLLQLEWTKIKRTRMIYILILLVLLAIGSYFFFIDKKSITLEEIEQHVAENVVYFEELVASMKKDSENLNSMEKEVISNMTRHYDGYVTMQEGVAARDWVLYWQGDLLNFSKQGENAQEQLETYKNSYMYPTPFTVLVHMDKMRWMEERAIQPLAIGLQNQTLTLYDQDFSDPQIEGIAQNLSQFYSSTGTYFLYHLFQYGFSLAGLIFFLFLFADILTKEGFGRNGPIHLLRTMPMRRATFWVSKALAVILGSLLIIGLVAVVGLGLGTLFNRLGDWQYPMLIYGPERTYTLLSLAEFLGKAGLLFVVMLAFGFSFLFLLSILTNRAILAIGLTVVVLVFGQQLTEQTLLVSWTHWLPFHYLDVYAILNGEYAILHNNPLLTYGQGMLSLIVSTFILLGITFGAVKLRKGVMS
ncbi:ABC transporter permease [Metasolibacillus meyeri]|uniref:ABC transporter permease n=1 Tax=Metasolibacillus meyeri TaxID=1071052 RepID=A0AAW9NPS9_9BACL|nr:ABC transporter permease [Metasolibacillus meyeri]MEC1178332.1 ABC transporter permease [Metasolibacillus meyeri]